jgi:uncharacterized membrane protein YjjB (DUF3815 family)
LELLVHSILSVLFGYAFAILLVEKGDDWPVMIFTKPAKILLNKIYNKLPKLLECTVCCSFWTTLVGEIVLKFWITDLFLWPFTGVIALGFTWSIVEFLNAIDSQKSNNSSNQDTSI